MRFFLGMTTQLLLFHDIRAFKKKSRKHAQLGTIAIGSSYFPSHNFNTKGQLWKLSRGSSLQGEF